MMNSIEKFLQIKINHDVVTLGHIVLGLSYSLMSRSPRLEAVGLRDQSPARPAKDASCPVCVRQVAVLLHTAFRRRLAVAALVLH